MFTRLGTCEDWPIDLLIGRADQLPSGWPTLLQKMCRHSKKWCIMILLEETKASPLFIFTASKFHWVQAFKKACQAQNYLGEIGLHTDSNFNLREAKRLLNRCFPFFFFAQRFNGPVDKIEQKNWPFFSCYHQSRIRLQALLQVNIFWLHELEYLGRSWALSCMIPKLH